MCEKIFSPIPNQFNGSCFGCSPNNPSGLQMKFEAGEDSVRSLITVPDHLCGWSTLVHGGVLTTILDEIMSWTAMHFLKQLVMTKSINMEFKKPVFVGEQLQAIGRISDQSNRNNVLLEGIILNRKEVECVKADAIFAKFSPKVASRLGIKDDDYPDWFHQE